MALGSDVKKQQIKPEDLEELLEGLEKLLDRTKVLYEQYFMGIQKVAPMQLHRDIERKVRELTQQQIRNTALRFRFTTISQEAVRPARMGCELSFTSTIVAYSLVLRDQPSGS